MDLSHTEDGGLGYWKAILGKTKQEKQLARIKQMEKRAAKRQRRERGRKEHLVHLAEQNRLKNLPNTDRESEAYKAWRLAVLRRDGFRCVCCHSKKDLHVHHCFASYAESRKRRLDVNNGVTVCKKCHADIHPWMKEVTDGTRRS